MNAGKDSSPEARQAFGQLYRDYLAPLQAYLRQHGRTEDEAQEVTQGFFEFLLERRGLAKAQPGGRFRSWLLGCLKHYMSDLWDRQRAIKRGGGAVPVALGRESTEAPVDPPHPGLGPDQEFDRQFALRFVELIMARLGREYQGRGKRDVFQCLVPFLLERKGELSHAELGRRLNLNENTVTQEISRLRKRYRAIFDEELERLVGSRAEAAEEKRSLLAALRS